MFRKILESLKRKYGPLPLWAWTAIAGAGVYLWNRRRGGPTEADASQPAFAPSYGFGEEPDYGDTGGGGGGAGDGTVSAPVMPGGGDVDYFPDNKLRMEAMELIDQIRGIQDELGTATYAPAVDGGEEIIEPDVPAQIATKAKAAQPAKGVKWGGQTFKTKAGLAGLLARTTGGSPASAFKRWAKRHPGAAKKLSGPAPKAAVKQPPKPAKQPSARTGARQPAKAGGGAAGARARNGRPGAPQPARPRNEPPPRVSPKPAPKPAAKAAPKPPKPRRSPKPRRRGGGV